MLHCHTQQAEVAHEDHPHNAAVYSELTWSCHILCVFVCRSWRQSLCSAVCGVLELVLSRSPAVRIVTGDSIPSVVPRRMCMFGLLWCPILLWSAELQFRVAGKEFLILLHNCRLTVLYFTGSTTSFATRLEWGQWTVTRCWLGMYPPSLCMSTASTQINSAGR